MTKGLVLMGDFSSLDQCFLFSALTPFVVRQEGRPGPASTNCATYPRSSPLQQVDELGETG